MSYPSVFGYVYCDSGADDATVLPTASSIPGIFTAFANQRLPTDPLFYSDVILENIVVGSRYRIALNSDDTELSKGTSASTTETISSLPCYTNPQLLKCDVRYSSATPKYIPLTIYSYQDREGANFFVSQIEDTVAV